MTSPTVGQTLDTAASVTQLVGSLATFAVNFGNVAVPVLEGVALLLPWLPGIGPVLADVQIALPIIKNIAAYAPAVQNLIKGGKPIAEALVSLGGGILSPLGNLEALFPGIEVAGVVVGAFLHANEFTPQDPRFARASGNPSGG